MKLKIKKRKCKKMWLSIIFSFFLSNHIHAEEPATSLSQPILNKKANNQKLIFDGGLSSLSTNEGSATAIDYGISFLYALDKKKSLIGSLKQGINSSGFGTLYTDIGFGLAYAYRGNLFSQDIEEISIDGKRSVVSKPYNTGGIYTTIMIKQYFFNGTEATVPIVGLSFGGHYVYPSSKDLNLQLSLNLNHGKNGENTLTAIKFLVGFQYNL